MRIVPYHIAPHAQRRPLLSVDTQAEPAQEDEVLGSEITPEEEEMFAAQTKAREDMNAAMRVYLLETARTTRHYFDKTAKDVGESPSSLPDATLSAAAAYVVDTHGIVLALLLENLLEEPMQTLLYGCPLRPVEDYLREAVGADEAVSHDRRPVADARWFASRVGQHRVIPGGRQERRGGGL